MDWWVICVEDVLFNIAYQAHDFISASPRKNTKMTIEEENT